MNPPANLVRPGAISRDTNRRTVSLLEQLNLEHMAAYPGDSELAARIASYELAGRMQTSVPEVMAIDGESKTILHLLGLDHERLTYYHNGIQRRLTDVHGHVIRDMIA